jgi:mannose-6-phosphate isomerase
MELIKATEQDLKELLSLYRRTAEHMEDGGLHHWHWGVYPTEELIREDVRNGWMYIERLDGVLAAAVAMPEHQEPKYDHVEWTYGVHPGQFRRLAVNPSMQGMGLGGGVMDDVQQMLRRKGCDCIRCDTSIENARALRLYEKMGFHRCGRIRWEGAAYENVCFDKPLKRETPLWPIRMTPAFRGGKLTPWGGVKLRQEFGKDVTEAHTGESLEVSCIPGLESRDQQGRTLTELIQAFGGKLVGAYADQPFPLLLKLIDARESLSVQVHPGDSYAATHENGKLGKTEAWLILDTPAGGGELVYGIKPGTSLPELRKACEAGSAVEPLLRRVQVHPGDVCYIPAGCVHAIGAGITLYEIQQSSDLTYRFYDWDRVDQDGNRREIHLEKGLAVTNLKLDPQPVRAEKKPGVRRVLSETYFTLDILNVEDEQPLPPLQDFGMLTCLEGKLTLRWTGGSMILSRGETCFLPTLAPEITLHGAGEAALSMPS